VWIYNTGDKLVRKKMHSGRKRIHTSKRDVMWRRGSCLAEKAAVPIVKIKSSISQTNQSAIIPTAGMEAFNNQSTNHPTPMHPIDSRNCMTTNEWKCGNYT